MIDKKAIKFNLQFVTAALAFTCASTASAQMILSNKYGEAASLVPIPGRYEQAEYIRERMPADWRDGSKIAEEFHRLCVTTDFDQGAYRQEVVKEGSLFKQDSITLEAQGKRPEITFEVFRKPSVLTSLWVGENGGDLDGRFQVARSRGALVTGPFRAKNFHAPQCNYSLRSRSLKSGQLLADTLKKLIAQEADKLVLKKGFADGYWLLSDPNGQSARVAFSIVDMKKPTQLVHMSYQILPQKKKKK